MMKLNESNIKILKDISSLSDGESCLSAVNCKDCPMIKSCIDRLINRRSLLSIRDRKNIAISLLFDYEWTKELYKEDTDTYSRESGNLSNST